MGVGLEQRRDILSKLLKDEMVAGDIDYQFLAETTDGYSGSDLKVRALFLLPRT